MADTEQKLRVLSSTFAVLGWLAVPASFVTPVIMFVKILRADPLPPPPLPALFGGISVFALIASLSMSACIIYAGRAVSNRRRHTFCVVVSVLMCLSVPIGTVIGVFALTVLTDPEAKALFVKNAGITPLTPSP